MTTHFPKDFMWGTATAAFQIEGATKADGRGESIWDHFAATPGKVQNGDTGDPACESYYRYEEDIDLMKAMNTSTYRFSVAWPRVIPDGDGAVNPVGLDYYERLTDTLLAAGITPTISLYHWDLPQALQDKGGWGSRATINAYVRYVDATVSRLGDRVKYWSTFNEPWCISILSHYYGEHAPGLHDRKLAVQVAHHLLVAHGQAMPVIRQRSPQSKAGIVLNMEPAYPYMDTDADRYLAAVHHATFNQWFIGPIMGQGYPQVGLDFYGEDSPEIRPGDMETIQTPLDFLGLNYYTRHIAHDPDGGEGPILNPRDDHNVSARDWEIYPDGLYDLLTWLHRDYPQIPEFQVCENGIACDDRPEDGRVRDSLRISYIRQHLAAAQRAIQDGVPLRGYFAWSLMDNFEWACGYDSRFGMVYVDFATQKRTLKDSALWYARVAAANALVD